MMTSMILLIATSSMMSCAKRLDINPSMVPQTGHMMQPPSVIPANSNYPHVAMQDSPIRPSRKEEAKPTWLAKLIPGLGKNDGSTKALLAQLDEETWDKAAAVLVDMTRKEEAKASKSASLATMDVATWDAVAGKVSEVALGCAACEGVGCAGCLNAEGLDTPMWAKAAMALKNIAREEKAKAAWHAKIAKAIAPVLAAGVLATAAEPAFAGDAAAGEQIFSGNCAACHAGGQNVIMPEKTLEQAALEEYLDGGANEAAVMKQVTNGKNAMPAFGSRLSQADIQNVATYVISTAKEGWD